MAYITLITMYVFIEIKMTLKCLFTFICGLSVTLSSAVGMHVMISSVLAHVINLSYVKNVKTACNSIKHCWQQ